MKKYFTTGIAILLPVILTFMIVTFLIDFITYPFLETTKALVEKWNLFDHPFFYIHRAALIILSSKLLILLMLCLATLLIGLFGKLFFIDIFFRFGDYLLHKLPLINKIYKASTDVVHSLFSSSSKKFSQVVFVPFPSPGNLCVGLVTGEAINICNIDKHSTDLVSVFVPGTPNPSVGFILMFKKEQLIYANMKVDEAMKFIVSCGVVMPEFKILNPHETHEKQFFSEDYLSSRKGQHSQNCINLQQNAGSV